MYIHDIEYHNPKSKHELLQYLDKYGENSKLLAGGTDLILQMKFNKWPQKYIINLKNVTELKKIKVDETYFTVGCNITLTELLDNSYVKNNYKALWHSINELADRQIRNRGTLAGNICNASPAADTSTPLMAYGALVSIQSLAGHRVVPLHTFFTGPGKTSLKENEFVDEIKIPLPPRNTFCNFQKLGRTYDDIAIINAAARVELDDKGRCLSASITMGAVAPAIKQAVRASSLLKGQKLTESLILEAAAEASREADPITDVRASAEYRKKMAGVLVKRALTAVNQKSKLI